MNFVMVSAEYRRLIDAFLEGRVTEVAPESLPGELRPVLSALIGFRKRRWSSFDESLAKLAAPASMATDMEFLRAISNIAWARYDEASEGLGRVMTSLDPDCILVSRELILFNQ